MDQVPCPHCGSGNDAEVAFCASCGKALPSSHPTGPRFIVPGTTAMTSAGFKLQLDELHQKARTASGALLAVAIIQTIFIFIVGSIATGVGLARRSPGALGLTMLLVPVVAVGVIFWGLYFWSRKNPLPAAIVGLVVYVSVWALDIIGGVMMLQQQGVRGAGPAGVGPVYNPISSGIVIRIIIIAILVRAIQAGAEHRKLLRQQAAGPVPVLSA